MLTSDEQAAARRVLLRLAAGERGMLVRRRCPYAEAAYDEPCRRVVDALAAARLITIEAATVEVAHEALFDNWPRLANWLEEDEHGRRLRAHLAPAVLAWDESGRPEADLYRGVRLDAAVDWAGEHPTDLTPAERDFLAASVTAAEQELQAERARTAHEVRARHRLRVLLTAVAGAAAIAVAASIVAVGQRSTATGQARLATARQLGAAALISQPLDRSLLLAASAVRIDNNVNTRSNLLAALQRSPAAQSVWRGDGAPLDQLALTEDGQTMVAAGRSGFSTWNLAGGRTPTATQLFGNNITPLVAARPGTDEIAIANIGTRGTDFADPIQLWDPRHHRQIGQDISGLTAPASSLAWSSDGRWLAVAQHQSDVLVWDVEHPSRPPLPIKRYRPADIPNTIGPPFPAVVYAGDDRFAVIEQSGDAQVRSPGSARPVRTFSVGTRGDVASVASNPQGTMLAVGHTTGTVTLSSLADGRPLQTLTGHSASVEGITFSPDGRLIATFGGDNAVNVTDLVNHRVLGRLTGHTGPVTTAAFTQNDHTLYTGSTDGTVLEWDTANLNNLGAQLNPPGDGEVLWMTASWTGEIAMGYLNGDVRFWPSDSLSPTRRIEVSDQPLTAGAFSPDGRLLATSDLHGRARLVDVRSQRVFATVAHLSGPARAVAFSPDGRKIVWADDNGVIYYFDAASRRQLGPALPLLYFPQQLVWSPDSRHIAVTDSRAIVVYRAGTSVEQWRRSTSGGASGRFTYPSLAWSPDGTTIAASGDAATGIQLLRASDGTPIGGQWKDHILTNSIAYSPDNATLASIGSDGTIVLRDVATGDQIGPALTASYTPFYTPFYNQNPAIVAFDAAGHLIIARDGGLWRWNIDLAYLMHQACTIAGRNLTAEEWADLHTARPYLAACN